MSPRWQVTPAAVALDLLDEHEQDVARRLMAEDPQFRAEVERMRDTTRRLGELDLQSWRPAPPPPLDDDRAVTIRPPRRTRRWAGRPRLALGAAATALAVVIAGIVLMTSGGGDGVPTGQPSLRAALTLRALGGVSGEARLTIDGGDARLSGEGMPPSGPNDYYEAWVADDRGRMVPMGTFRVNTSGKVDAHMPVAVDLRRYRVVDVSLEPDDGDARHSGKSVMRAEIPRTL